MFVIVPTRGLMADSIEDIEIQLLLDAVNRYLPAPGDSVNVALDQSNGEAPMNLENDPAKPLVALAFKLEESRFGQLTYLRIYQGM